jgi:hypothetical protein
MKKNGVRFSIKYFVIKVKSMLPGKGKFIERRYNCTIITVTSSTIITVTSSATMMYV